jgi:hypothetical protein
MAHNDTDAQRAAQAAIDEAARTLADSSRRTTEQAQYATRTLLDQSAELGRSLFNAWTSSSETLWRVAFELHNAQLSSALRGYQTLADASTSTVQLLQQWEGLTRQTQQAWLELLQASAGAVANAAEQGARAAERGRRASR